MSGTFEIIEGYQEYLKEKVGVNVRIGPRETGSTEETIIHLIPDNTFSLYNRNEKSEMSDIPLTVQIIGSRQNEREVFSVLDQFLNVTNQYQKEKGHLIDAEAEPVYDDNRFAIALTYTIKNIYLDQ